MRIEEVFGSLPPVETPRLILRKLTPDDAQDMFEYASDPEMTRYVAWSPHTSIESSQEFIAWVMNRYERGQVANWGVERKGGRKLIGTCGYGWWDVSNAHAEIGYALARRYWNQGLTTEAVKAVIAFGFQRMGLHRVQATCAIENIASARVMEKAGMQFEGVLRGYMLKKGVYFDQKMYSILRDEWRAS